MNTDLQNLAIEAAKMLAIHSTWMLLLVFALSKRFRNTFLKRTLWRSTFVALSLLILLTFSGLHQWDWLSIQTINQKPQVDVESPSQWKPLILVEPQSPDIISLPTNTMPAEALESAHSTNALSFAIALGVAWLAGSISFLTLMIFNATAWRWRLRRQTQPASDHLKSVFNQAAKRLSFTRTPTLAESSLLTSPLVMGCVRPVIVFPEDHASRYQPEEQHLIMCHEIAHLREHDGWWQCLANLVAITLWWNPVVWLARQSLRQTAEETADSISVGHDKEGEQLAACLVRIGREISSTQWTGSLSIFGAGFRSQLGKRVERLLTPHPKMHIQPKPLMTGTIRLLTPVLLMTILSGSTSWLGLSRTESASDSIQRSVFGMMLLAVPPLPNVALSQSAAESLKDNKQEDIPSKQAPLLKLTIEQHLKSIVIPQFTYTVELGEKQSQFGGNYTEGIDLTLTNLRNLRESILDADPSWENLTIQLRMAAVKEKDHSLNLTETPHENSLNLMVVGPLKELPSDIPAFDRFPNKTNLTIFPEIAGVSSVNAIGYVKMKNTSAFELLFSMMQVYDIQDHHHYAGHDTVVFDLSHSRSIPKEFTNSQPTQSMGDPNLQSVESLIEKEHTHETLMTRTYKVNPTTLVDRINTMFGITSLKPPETDLEIQRSIQRLFVNLGINVPALTVSNSGNSGFSGGMHTIHTNTSQDSKAFFLNDRNGTLFVRATEQDFTVLEAALANLQEPGERNTKITLDMHIVQLDESGIKVLQDFGFDKPVGENSGQFEHIIDTPTLQRLLLRMNLTAGVELLQSPHITALNGRQSELKAQELRRIVTHYESGNIQTEEVATGPTLSVIPRLQANGHLELTAHFELLEFVGYDDPGPFQIISQDADQKSTGGSQNMEGSSIDDYQKMLKEMDLAPKREAPEIILKYMPNQLKLKHLSNELETAKKTKLELEFKVAKNAKDTINTQRNLAAVKALIPTFQKQVDQEVTNIRRLIRSMLENRELSEVQANTSREKAPTETNGITRSGKDSLDNVPLPLPRFKRLELNTKTTLQSGQTLVMGGLKSTETIRWKNNVPIMSKIPLLGGMFRREGTSTTEQYIYVLITPRILE